MPAAFGANPMRPAPDRITFGRLGVIWYVTVPCGWLGGWIVKRSVSWVVASPMITVVLLSGLPLESIAVSVTPGVRLSWTVTSTLRTIAPVPWYVGSALITVWLIAVTMSPCRSVSFAAATVTVC